MLVGTTSNYQYTVRVLLDYLIQVPLCLVYLIVELSDTWREEVAEYETSVFDPTLEEINREEQVRLNHLNFDSDPRRDIFLTDELYLEDYLFSLELEQSHSDCIGSPYCAICRGFEAYRDTL